MKKFIIVISLVLAAIILALSANYAYIYYSRQKVIASINSVSIVNNPEEIESIENCINYNMTIEDAFSSEDEKLYKNFSSKEINMVYNIEEYNVYKIDVTFSNNSSFQMGTTIADYCRENTYMMVPRDFTYYKIAENNEDTYSDYVFVSKKYTLTDIQKYLKNNGINYNVLFQRKLSAGFFTINAKFDK